MGMLVKTGGEYGCGGAMTMMGARSGRGLSGMRSPPQRFSGLIDCCPEP
jgi:hypothetical protein